MPQTIKRAIPPPPGGIGRAFVILSVPAVGISQKTSARGWGILLEAVNVVPFSRVCLNVAGRDSRVVVAGAGAGKGRGCG